MADQERDKKARVVKNMIETLNSQKSSKFHVMLFQYYIDTERYATSANPGKQKRVPFFIAVRKCVAPVHA
jgi:hypothetical protein